MSTAAVAITDFVILYVMMRRYAGALETGAFFKTVAKLLVAGALLAGVCWAAVEFYLGTGSHLATLPKLFAVMATVGVGVSVFFGTPTRCVLPSCKTSSPCFGGNLAGKARSPRGA
jgi:peptidoglycan biosynthesis protein MviN/MurJ (putative lipid II flippase)